MVRRRETRRSAAISAAERIAKQDQGEEDSPPPPGSPPPIPEIDLSTLGRHHTFEADHLHHLHAAEETSSSSHQHHEVGHGGGGGNEGEEEVDQLDQEQLAAPLDLNPFMGENGGVMGMDDAAHEAFWASLPQGDGTVSFVLSLKPS